MDICELDCILLESTFQNAQDPIKDGEIICCKTSFDVITLSSDFVIAVVSFSWSQVCAPELCQLLYTKI